MGQIKNIKLHIVTDIKCLVDLRSSKQNMGGPKLRNPPHNPMTWDKLIAQDKHIMDARKGFFRHFTTGTTIGRRNMAALVLGTYIGIFMGIGLKKKVIAWNEATE